MNENKEILPPFMLGEPLPHLGPTNPYPTTWPLGPTLLIRYVSLVTLGNAFILSVS